MKFEQILGGNRQENNVLASGEKQSLTDAIDQVLSNAKVHALFAENKKKLWLGAQLNHENSIGEGHWECFRFGNDFHLLISDFYYNELLTDHFSTQNMLDFHVKLKGSTTVCSGNNAPMKVKSPIVLVGKYIDSEEWNIDMHPEKEKSITIFFKPDYLYDNFLTDSKQIPVHLARFLLNQSNNMSHCQLSVTSEILDAATTIISASKQFQNQLWLHQVHGRAEELICHIIDSFDRLNDSANKAYSKTGIEQLREAKKIISEQFEKPPTIKLVAKQVGTSETKLKEGFKVLFGETIFECRNRQRMKRAVQLIKNNLPIVQIAEQVGYQHQASFTNAFKAYYNVTPMQYRKKLSQLKDDNIFNKA